MQRSWLLAAGLAVVLCGPALTAQEEGPAADPEEVIPADDLTPAAESDDAARETGDPQVEADSTADGEAGAALSGAFDEDGNPIELPEPEPPKTEFTIPVAEEDGGGQIRGQADEVVRRGDNTVTLLGGVEISYKRMKIQAQQIDVDLATRVATATGDVILDEGPNRYGASRMEMDLDDETGRMENATASLVPDIYFRGDVVEKIGPMTYIVEHGMFSACEGDVPAWSFRTGKAKVTLEGYAHASNITFRAKKLPLIYVPYLLFPVKSKRTSGLLMPNFSTSELHGTGVGLAWFQTFGPSYDATFQFENFSEDFLAYGTEFRYRPTQNSRGYLRARFIDDETAGETHHRVSYVHETVGLPGNSRALIDFVDFDEIDFFRLFDRDLGRNSRRSWRSNAYLTGAVGPQSYSLQVDQRETLFSDATLIQRQLPEFEYRLRSVQLRDWPLYFQLEGAAHYIASERQPDDPLEEPGSTDYGRVNLVPALTVPIQTVPWLSVNLRAVTKATWYQKSRILAEETEDPDLVGEIEGDALTRVVPAVGAEIVGPTFSRVFDRGIGKFEKFKHVIEPRWTYSYASDFEEQNKVPRFDEIDGVSARHTATFSFVQRLLAKPEPPPEPEDDELGGEDLETDAGAVADVEASEEDGEDATDADDTAEALVDTDGLGVEDGEDDSLDQIEKAVATEEEVVTADSGVAALRELQAVGAREVMSLEILKAYSFEPEQPLQTLRFPAFEDRPAEVFTRQGSPIQMRYRFNPSRVTSLRADAQFSPLAGEMQRYSISGEVGFDPLKRNYVGLSWNRSFFIVDDPNTGVLAGETVSDQLGLKAGFSFWDDRVRFRGSINLDLDPGEERDLTAPELQRQHYILEYRGPCAGVLFELQESNRLGFLEGEFQEVSDQKFRVAISLRHIGTFLDFGFGDGNDDYSQNFSF